MIAGRQLGRYHDALGPVQLEEVSLSASFNQAFPPWAKDITAVEFELLPQLLDGLLVFLDGLLVEFCGFVQCSFEVLNLLIVEFLGLIKRGLEVSKLLSEPVQDVVTFPRISRP